MSYEQNTQTLTLLNAVTATTISAVADVDGWKKMSLQVVRANHGTGNTVFTVEISNDNSNWNAYQCLVSNVTNTNIQGLTRVASLQLSTNGNNFLYFDDLVTFRYIRVTATETSDGTHSAILYVTY